MSCDSTKQPDIFNCPTMGMENDVHIILSMNLITWLQLSLALQLNTSTDWIALCLGTLIKLRLTWKINLST